MPEDYQDDKILRSAMNITRKKFEKLSSGRQHQLLMILSQAAAHSAHPEIGARFEELVSWGNIDQYHPPAWLNDDEIWLERSHFHRFFVTTPIKSEEKFEAEVTHISWKPVFNYSIVVDQLRSPFNAGSLLRLIDNLGFRELLHNSAWLNLNHPQLKKSARGCEHWIPCHEKRDLLDYLMELDEPVIAVEQKEGSISYLDWDPPPAAHLVLGNEQYGVAQKIIEICDSVIHIPIFGFKHSLNVHHALAIIGHRITEKLQNR